MRDLVAAALRGAGVHQFGFVPVGDLKFYDEIRDICAGNSCRQYGRSWACPPAAGTLEDCRERCLSYGDMAVFSGRYGLEDSFDFEGMHRAMADFKALSEAADARLRLVLSRYQILSNEGCGKCEKCTYPSAPCRFPHRLHHAIEGYGLNVSELAAAAGIEYFGGAGTVTYFGAALF